MASLDEMSSKFQTETSAKRWQEKEGGFSSPTNISHRLYVDIFINGFKSSNIPSLTFIIMIRGLDEYQMVFSFVCFSTNCKLDPSKSGKYTQYHTTPTEANDYE